MSFNFNELKPKTPTNQFCYTKSPEFITGTLRHYQVEGVNWMLSMYDTRTNAILADEMGLGKTLQTITFLGHMTLREKIKEPHLLIVPKSILLNWKSEFAKFCDKMKIFIFHGSKEDFPELQKKILRGNYDAIITTYEYVLKHKKILKKIDFNSLIIDEAHRIKNEESQLSKCVRELNCEFKMLLTGTPLQNNVKELWALLNFLKPNIFDNSEKFEMWVDKEEDGDDNDKDGKDKDDEDEEDNEDESEEVHRRSKCPKISSSTEDENTDPANKIEQLDVDELDEDVDEVDEDEDEHINEHIDKHNNKHNNKQINENKINEQDEELKKFLIKENTINKLRQILKLFFLRREKSDVEKSLLCKKVINLYPTLTEMQKKYYRSVLTKDVDVLGSSVGLGNILMLLRKACNHPYLFTGAEEDPSFTGEDLVANSCKLAVIDKLLAKKLDHSRFLIFTQFKGVLDILEDYCNLREYTYFRIDGDTTTDERADFVRRFQNKEASIFLLSTKAGGLGLNLVEANTVVFFDNDWNPQVDLQAMDRAHRIGQKKQVTVYRLIARGTIEERMMFQALRKLKLGEVFAKPTKGEILSAVAEGLDFDQAAEIDDINELIREGEEKTRMLDLMVNEAKAPQNEDYKELRSIIKDKILSKATFTPREVRYNNLERRRKSLFLRAPVEIPKGGHQLYPRELFDIQRREQRLYKMGEELSDHEKSKKQKLIEKGFEWTKGEFQLFLKSLEHFGRGEHRKIAAAIDKKPEEVKSYIKVFFKRMDELDDYKKIKNTIERAENLREKNSRIHRMLRSIFREDKGIVRSDLDDAPVCKIKYTQNTKHRMFTEEIDMLLLKSYYKHFTDKHVFEKVRVDLRNSEFSRFDCSLKFCNISEIQKRIITLIGCLLRMGYDKKNN